MADTLPQAQRIPSTPVHLGPWGQRRAACELTHNATQMSAKMTIARIRASLVPLEKVRKYVMVLVDGQLGHNLSCQEMEIRGT